MSQYVFFILLLFMLILSLDQGIRPKEDED